MLVRECTLELEEFPHRETDEGSQRYQRDTQTAEFDKLPASRWLVRAKGNCEYDKPPSGAAENAQHNQCNKEEWPKFADRPNAAARVTCSKYNHCRLPSVLFLTPKLTRLCRASDR
jgi:hypothetical protein